MKKAILALAVAALAATEASAGIPDANTGYIGAEVGWSNITNGTRQFDSKFADNGKYDVNVPKFGIHRHSPTYGIYGGYQIYSTDTFGVAAELGYNQLGAVKGKMAGQKMAKHSAQSVQLSLKPQVSIGKDLNTYGKVGVALVRNDYKLYDPNFKMHNTKPSLVLGAGFEYAITDAVSARVEYNWVSRLGNLNKAAKKADINLNVPYSPDAHTVAVGLTYRFGGVKQPVAVPQPDFPKATKTITLSSDVAFAFGKATLKDDAVRSLDKFAHDVRVEFAGKPAVVVKGYTDRIGSDEANLTLSQKRAEAVANHLVVAGIEPEQLQAMGYGKANAVTGATCDVIKGRKELISCLAPDRRVEITVEGKENTAEAKAEAQGK